MSVIISHYRFSNFSCREYQTHEFHGTHTCGVSSCGHSIELHSNVANDNNFNVFSTPQPEQLPQCPNATNELNTENTNLGLTTPNHRNFLPMLDSNASQTIVCTAASNEHKVTLNKDSDPHEKTLLLEKEKSYSPFPSYFTCTPKCIV